MFDVPAIVAGIAELADDLRDGVAAGLVPDHDTDLMAAAMFGTAFEVGVRLLEEDPPDVERAARFCADLFLGGLERLGRRSGR